jgi:hypothetical protein
MRILLDHCTPAPLGKRLSDHTVSTAYEMGWAGLDNGSLLRSAEQSFDIFVTTDRNLRHQQNLHGSRLAILVLPTTSWPKILKHISIVVAAVEAATPGDLREIQFPD